MCVRSDFGGSLVWAFPVGDEFIMFPSTSDGFHAMKNKIPYPNRLQLHCTVIEVHDVELV